jgi:hypothetical protein
VSRDHIDAEDMPQNGEVLSVFFPTSGQLRSRKVVTRSRARSTGKFPSVKMNRMLQWESTNELNAMYLLECDPVVTEFHEQPCEIRYSDGVNHRLHYPDLYVVTNGVKEIWEVKTEAEALRPETIARTNLMARFLPAKGYQYKQVLDLDLRRQPYLSNAKTMVHLGRRPVSLLEREALRRLLDARGFLSWSEASSDAYGTRGRQILCRLVLDGYLQFDRTRLLSLDTKFIARKVER